MKNFTEDDIKILSKELKFLSSIRTINYGGCGIAALLLYKRLRELGYAVEIVYAYYDSTFTLTHNENAKMGIERYFESCSHAFVSVNGLDIDSSGIISRTKYV